MCDYWLSFANLSLYNLHQSDQHLHGRQLKRRATLNKQIFPRCATRETKRFAWEWTVVLSTSLNRSGSALNKDKFTPLKWLFFCIVWISWADLGSLRSVLVRLLCPYITSESGFIFIKWGGSTYLTPPYRGLFVVCHMLFPTSAECKLKIIDNTQVRIKLPNFPKRL